MFKDEIIIIINTVKTSSCSEKIRLKRIEELKNLFSGYKTIINEFEKRPDISCDCLDPIDKFILRQFLDSMEIIEKKHPDKYLLFLRDNITTQVNSERIDEVLEESLEINNNCSKFHWDLFYLNNWLDDCSKRKKIGRFKENTHHGKFKEISLNNSLHIISKTFSPNSNLAIIVSPCARKKLINKIVKISVPLEDWLREHIKYDNLKAITTIPNVFQKDNNIFPGIEGIIYSRSCECDPDIPVNNIRSSPDYEPFLIFLLVVFIVIILSCAFIKLGPEPREPRRPRRVIRGKRS